MTFLLSFLLSILLTVNFSYATDYLNSYITGSPTATTPYGNNDYLLLIQNGLTTKVPANGSLLIPGTNNQITINGVQCLLGGTCTFGSITQQLNNNSFLQWLDNTAVAKNVLWMDTFNNVHLYDSEGPIILGSANNYTGSTGEVVMPEIATSGTAPGVNAAKLSWVAGTTAGTCKLVSYAGTSITPVTIVDNVGSGC